MADPERRNTEPSPLESAKQELMQYMQGAEIGSPKLLAFSDVLEDIALREDWEDLEGSKKKEDIQRLNLILMQLALLRHQSTNREVEIKGYAKASHDISNLVSTVEDLCKREGIEEGKSQHEIEFELDDTYRLFIFELFRSLTTEEQPPKEK